MQRKARKSTPYGPIISPKGTNKRFIEHADSIHIRELSFGDGGIGCGLWNSSIILSRFIMSNSNVFKGKVVHEVGAGIGLPILYSSFYCKRAIFSDYMTSLVDNYRYNVKCNTYQLDDWKTKLIESNECQQDHNFHTDNGTIPHYHHSKLWDMIFSNQQSSEKRIEDEDNDIISQQPETDYPQIDLMSFQEGDQHVANINKFVPNTCISHTDTCGCQGYTVPDGYTTLTFDNNKADILKHKVQCLSNMSNSSQGILFDWLNYSALPSILKDDLKCDIILGSEVSYPTILETLPSLVEIISTSLSDFGAFYLVQSPNRGTSNYFIESLCAVGGFLLDMRVVDLDVLKEFASGQRDEQYVYYSFRRPESPYPIMGIENDYVAPVDGLSERSLALINTNKKKLSNYGQLVDADEVSFAMKLAAPALGTSEEQKGLSSL